MLGNAVTDPGRVESSGQTARPLDLLPLSTEMAPDKVLRQTRAVFLPTGRTVRGYEIHHGRSAGHARPVMTSEDGETIGWSREDLSVWGTYLHGVFDDDAFRREFLDGLRSRKGLAPLGTVQAVYNVEAALDQLAETVRRNLDMKRIYGLLKM